MANIISFDKWLDRLNTLIKIKLTGNPESAIHRLDFHVYHRQERPLTTGLGLSERRAPMTIRTRQDYMDSLRRLKLNLWMFGEKVAAPVDHPIIVPSMNAVSFTYELALDPQYEDLMTATSHLTGKKINRFTHIFSGTEDLVKKVRRQRLLGQKTACCFQR